MGPVKKRFLFYLNRTGRIDMTRSNPEDKVEMKVTVKVDKE